VPSFTTTRDAKDFLISKILEEANRTSVDFTDIERKMLYFTETEPSLPDIYEVSAAFDEQCDQSDYEQKIASVISSYKSWAKNHDTAALAQWKAAVKMLKTEDHYLLVLIGLADGFISTLEQPQARPFSLLKFIAIIIVGTISLLLLIALWISFHQ
jgi:hypothetical protein